MRIRLKINRLSSSNSLDKYSVWYGGEKKKLFPVIQLEIILIVLARNAS